MLEQMQLWVKEIEEARALLARKDEVEREIVEAERRRDRAVAETEKAKGDLFDLHAKIDTEGARYEHEKRRHALHLEQVQKDVAQKTKELDEAHAVGLRKATQEHRDHLAVLASEKQEVEASIRALRTEYTGLQSLVADFKKRLGDLPA